MFWKWSLWKNLSSFFDAVAWHLFFLIFATVIIDDVVSLFLPDSNMFRFYAILYAFEPWSIVWYISNILQVLLNILIFIPFFCYIYNKHLPFQTIWPWILIGKLFFDISGHHYHFLEYKSMFYIKPSYGLVGALTQLIIWMPSYGAPISLLFREKLMSVFKKPLPD